MAKTLAQLLNPQTVDTTFNQEIALATALGFPTTSWQPGGVERARLLLFATMLSNLSSDYIPSVTGAGFLSLSSGDWLTLLAAYNYATYRNPASNTDGYLSFDTTLSGAGPVVVNAQSMFVIFPDGLRYVNADTFTIPAGSTISGVHFTSEFPVNTAAGLTYSEGNNQALQLLNPIPGVVTTNPEITFSTVIHNGATSNGAGAGTGDVTPSGAPLNKYFVIVRIDSSGNAGVATWSYSTDGNEYVSAGAVASAEIFDGVTDTGILVTLSNGADSPSFIIGDQYSFASTESWIFTQGADEESDASLRQRCAAQFNDLSLVPTDDFYSRLVKSVPGVGAQVTQVVVQPDGYVNGKVNIVIAGPAGELGAGTVSTVQQYVNPRVPTTEYPVVTSPGSLAVGVDFTITVLANSYATMYGSDGYDGTVGAALELYINTVLINGTVYAAQIVKRLMELTGAVDITGVLINGQSDKITLGSSTTFQLGFFDSGSSSFTFVRV